MQETRTFCMNVRILAAIGAATLLCAGCTINAPLPPPPVTVTTGAYSPGYVVTTLPVGYTVERYHRQVYYVNRGVYYRPYHSGGYVVVTRPY